MARPGAVFQHKVKYLGSSPWNSALDVRRPSVTFKDDQVKLYREVSGYGGLLAGVKIDKTDVEIRSLRFVAIEDAGEKSNVGALALFGVLGLSAKRKWTAITIGFAQGEGLFIVRQPLYEVRAKLRRAFASCPSLEQKLVEGPPPTDSATSESTRDDLKPLSTSAVDDLERLAALLDRGVITDEEFAALKAKLIDGSG